MLQPVGTFRLLLLAALVVGTRGVQEKEEERKRREKEGEKNSWLPSYSTFAYRVTTQIWFSQWNPVD